MLETLDSECLNSTAAFMVSSDFHAFDVSLDFLLRHKDVKGGLDDELEEENEKTVEKELTRREILAFVFFTLSGVSAVCGPVVK